MRFARWYDRTIDAPMVRALNATASYFRRHPFQAIAVFFAYGFVLAWVIW